LKIHHPILLGFILFAHVAFGQKDSHARRDSVLRELEQRDLIDFTAKLFNLGDSGKVKRKTEAGSLLLSVIPIAPAQAGQGKVAVSAINASFYTSAESNLSSLYFYPYTNFADSYGVILTPNIWLDHNRFNLTGDFRALKNVIEDYGLGTSAPKTELAVVYYDQVRTYLAAHTLITRYLYGGAGYFMDSFYNINQSDVKTDPRTNYSNYPLGPASNVVSSGITANVLRDSRRNSLNPRGGFYTSIVLRINDAAFGSTYTWKSIYVDSRKYFSFSDARHKILAVRALYWGASGDVPYLNLPATLQDFNGRAGRGYNNGRYRGKQMLFAEAEYRFDITDHGFFGATVFANAQSFTEASGKFESIAPAAGVGLRLKFNRKSDINIALDFGVGRDGLNFNVNLGEYF
jgi:hypothetical protein